MDECFLRSFFGGGVHIVYTNRWMYALDFIFRPPLLMQGHGWKETIKGCVDLQPVGKTFSLSFSRRRADGNESLFRDKEGPELFLDIVAASGVAYQSFFDLPPLRIWT